MIRQVQLFIHRYYDAIKLVMLFIILAMVGLGILYQFEINARADEERGKAILTLTSTIEDKTDGQTALQTRQMQALCYLIVQTAGEDALTQLDPPLEEQCRNLAGDLKRLEAMGDNAPTASAPGPASSTQPAPVIAQTAPSPLPVVTRSPSPKPSPTPAATPRPCVLGLLGLCVLGAR
ncbi:hypothetical protein [Mycolicibacterium sp. S3B2]|uniref:hypothetical protein n=1 Tax=Mycolicibacterium sp. S3B2 TaxID=3415120 RepID=UPI003C7A7EE5